MTVVVSEFKYINNQTIKSMNYKKAIVFTVLLIIVFAISGITVHDSKIKSERTRLIQEKDSMKEYLRIFKEQNGTSNIIGAYSYGSDTWSYSQRDAYGNVHRWQEKGYMDSPTQEATMGNSIVEGTLEQIIKELEDSIKVLDEKKIMP